MIKVDRNKCLVCGGCVATCPVSALTLKDRIECNEDCTNCKICINFCPFGALNMEDEK